MFTLLFPPSLLPHSLGIVRWRFDYNLTLTLIEGGALILIIIWSPDPNYNMEMWSPTCKVEALRKPMTRIKLEISQEAESAVVRRKHQRRRDHDCSQRQSAISAVLESCHARVALLPPRATRTEEIQKRLKDHLFVIGPLTRKRVWFPLDEVGEMLPDSRVPPHLPSFEPRLVRC